MVGNITSQINAFLYKSIHKYNSRGIDKVKSENKSFRYVSLGRMPYRTAIDFVSFIHKTVYTT